MMTRLILSTACTFGIMTGAALAQSSTPANAGDTTATGNMPAASGAATAAKPMASPMPMKMSMKHHHHWMASNAKSRDKMGPSSADHSADQLNAQELTKGAS